MKTLMFIIAYAILVPGLLLFIFGCFFFWLAGLFVIPLRQVTNIFDYEVRIIKQWDKIWEIIKE